MSTSMNFHQIHSVTQKTMLFDTFESLEITLHTEDGRDVTINLFGPKGEAPSWSIEEAEDNRKAAA